MDPKTPDELEFALKVIIKLLLALACGEFYKSSFANVIKSTAFNEFLYDLKYGLYGLSIDIYVLFTSLYVV